MASIDLLAATVMNTSASLMNDTARTVYTYAVQVPYLNMALRELQEYFELHNIPATQQVSALINIPAPQTQIVFNGVGVPSLPSDMIEPLQLWERAEGIDPYIPMTKKDFLPHYLDGTTISTFGIYVWQDNKIKFMAASRDNDIKIDYLKHLFTPVVDSTSIINAINAQTFLEYRTAALMAEFIERNKSSSDSLNGYATLAIDRATGIGIKGKQNIGTRRKPFRASYKRRG